MDKTNINEAVDLHLLDLQEAQRRDDVYNDLNEVIDKLQDMTVYPSLLWVWTFDIIRDIYENNQEPQEYIDEIVPAGITLKKIFNKFWEDVDGLGFTMDNGGEILEEVIRDWMRESGFLVYLEDLTQDEDSDTINANQLQKGNTMQHEHYWDTPSDKSLVAECACGEQLERVQD